MVNSKKDVSLIVDGAYIARQRLCSGLLQSGMVSGPCLAKDRVLKAVVGDRESGTFLK